jgi:hypothetical protein
VRATGEAGNGFAFFVPQDIVVETVQAEVSISAIYLEFPRHENPLNIHLIS